MNQYAFGMEVKAGLEEEYRCRHQAVWPSVLAACRAAGIYNYSIFMAGRQLFAYLESEDFEASSRLLAQNPEIAQWEEFMAPIMAVTRADNRGKGTDLLPLVFHLD